MKRLVVTVTLLFISSHLFPQGCTVSAFATKDTIVCSQSAFLSAYGIGQGSVILSENFNNGSFGAGWQATMQAMWNNPCSASGVDSTTHVWMGNSSPVPRILTTTSFDLSSCAIAGVVICFDMKFAEQGDVAPCEGPDEPQEGVYLQYNINGDTLWHTIHYYDPNGGSEPQLINWNNWCFPVPDSALTSTTKFRWFQNADSGADFDHWGIDNVNIYCNDPTFNIIWQHDGYNAGANGGTNPTPVAPNITTDYVVVMSNGTISCFDTVTIVVVNPVIVVDAGADTIICNGQCALLNATAKIVERVAQTPTYMNNEAVAIQGTPGFPAFPPTTPATPGTAFAKMDINVTGLNLDNVQHNHITSVCIDSMFIVPNVLEIFDIWLLCPSGDSILLLKDSTIAGGTLTNTCFVATGNNIAASSTPYSGSYAPNQSFNNLVGCNANGVWSIHFSATFEGFLLPTGVFKGWSISFNDPEISRNGNLVWSYSTAVVDSNTLTPTVCPLFDTALYTLTVFDTTGCIVPASDTIQVITETCTGLNNFREETAVNIYPNPLWVGHWQLTADTKLIGSKIEIVDARGGMIYQTEIKTEKSTIQLNTMAGIYFLKINTDNGVVIKKLIKF